MYQSNAVLNLKQKTYQLFSTLVIIILNNNYRQK